jgi:hypothetical protein
MWQSRRTSRLSGFSCFGLFLGVAPMLISLRDCQQAGRDPI